MSQPTSSPPEYTGILHYPDGSLKMGRLAVMGLASVVAIVAGWKLYNIKPDEQGVKTDGASVEPLIEHSHHLQRG